MFHHREISVGHQLTMRNLLTMHNLLTKRSLLTTRSLLTMHNLLTMRNLLTMHIWHSSIFNSPTKNLFNYIICIYSGVTGSLIVRLLLVYTKAKLTFKTCIDFNVFYTVTVNIEWLSNECRKTNIKIITETNHGNKQRDEPIKIPSNYL